MVFTASQQQFPAAVGTTSGQIKDIYLQVASGRLSEAYFMVNGLRELFKTTPRSA